MGGVHNEVVYGANMDFREVWPPVGQITSDGQIFIGAAVAPFLRGGFITSLDSSVTITLGPGTIDLSASGGGSLILDGDSGSATGSTITLFANQATLNSGSSVKFVNSGSTSTFNVTDSFHNTIIGNGAGSLTNDGFNFNNTGFGMTVLTALDPTGATGNGNSTFGYQSMFANINGNNCSAFGMNSLQGSNDSNVSAFGAFTLGSATAGSDTCVFGFNGFGLLLTGKFNAGIGSNVGINYVGAESSNILMMNAGVVGESNVMRLGTQGTGDGQINSTFIAGIAGVTTSNSQFVTVDTTTGEMGSAAAPASGIVTINGDSGSITGTTVTIDANNAANECGSTVKFVNSGTASHFAVSDASNNTFFGRGSGNGTLSGIFQAGFGYEVLQNIGSGVYNIGFGFRSGYNYTGSESSNININNMGVLGESNTIRIGTQGNNNAEQNTCFIAGITGATVTGAAVLCSTSGQLGTVVSSERFKENIKEISSSKITDLTPVSFTYKVPKHPPVNYIHDESVHFGMIAEDVHKKMPELVIYDDQGQPFTIKYHEMYALLLAEIKSLRLEVNDLKKGVQ